MLVGIAPVGIGTASHYFLLTLHNNSLTVVNKSLTFVWLYSYQSTISRIKTFIIMIHYIAYYKHINSKSIAINQSAVNQASANFLLAMCPWVPILALPLFYWVATLGKLFTHITSPVFSAPRNWGTKGSIRTIRI